MVGSAASRWVTDLHYKVERRRKVKEPEGRSKRGHSLLAPRSRAHMVQDTMGSRHNHHSHDAVMDLEMLLEKFAHFGLQCRRYGY